MNVSFGTFITNLFFSGILLFTIGLFFNVKKILIKYLLRYL